jgi:1,2-diacylglycerol-3-alpha-glucose alpha-1,2-glucosyltransferase
MAMDKLIFISCGVDTKKFSFDENKRQKIRATKNIIPEELIVVNVAMALKRKGLDTFIYLGEKFPNVKFWWFGKVFNVLFSPKIPKTKPNVTFCGYVPDITEAYLSADIFLFPTYEEQQGISVLEAGGIGLPVLVRDIPVYYGWLKDGQNCLKARNNEEFEKQLSRLLQDSPLRKKLGSELHKLIVNEHSFEIVANKFNVLYQKILET